MALAFLSRGSRTRKPEAEFQSAIIRYLRQRFGRRFWYCNVCGGLGMRAGLPDLLCSIDGRMVALEIKNPNGHGRLGPRQKDELAALLETGAVAAVVASWDDLEAAIATFAPSQRGMRDK